MKWYHEVLLRTVVVVVVVERWGLSVFCLMWSIFWCFVGLSCVRGNDKLSIFWLLSYGGPVFWFCVTANNVRTSGEILNAIQTRFAIAKFS